MEYDVLCGDHSPYKEDMIVYTWSLTEKRILAWYDEIECVYIFCEIEIERQFNLTKSIILATTSTST